MIRNITNVKGIKCWGAHTGVKSMRRDLAIIYSEVQASAAATFTQNKVQAEPIKISQRHLKNNRAQVIVCNAGNANACTGEQGRLGAEAMADAVAEMLHISAEDVIVASTGLIGEKFPTEDVVEGIKINIPKLSDNAKAGSFVANAILTTDTFAKEGFLLGHASVVCIPEEYPIIDYLEHLFRFTAHESCGKCFPCRLGSTRGAEMIAKAREGNYKMEITLMNDLLETLETGSLCALGGGLPLPVKNAMKYFKDELAPYFNA